MKKTRVEILQKNAHWKLSGMLRADIRKIIASTLDKAGFYHPYEVSIVLCGDQFIRKYNREFMGKDRPTNVLSFPSGDLENAANTEDLTYLGDVIISYNTLLRESLEQGKTFQNHCTHMLVHGILHLLGYDHIAPQDQEKMEALEVEILKSMGINNPYYI